MNEYQYMCIGPTAKNFALIAILTSMSVPMKIKKGNLLLLHYIVKPAFHFYLVFIGAEWLSV